MEIYREFSFDAAHRLTGLPPDHRCSGLHGHTYTVRVFLEGPLQTDRGWVRDYGDVKDICAPVIGVLDHSCLNEIEGLSNPTSENIAVWLWKRLKPLMPELSQIEICETQSTGCRYRGC